MTTRDIIFGSVHILRLGIMHLFGTIINAKISL